MVAIPVNNDHSIKSRFLNSDLAQQIPKAGGKSKARTLIRSNYQQEKKKITER